MEEEKRRLAEEVQSAAKLADLMASAAFLARLSVGKNKLGEMQLTSDLSFTIIGERKVT